MRCEICGKSITGKPLKTKIEGSLMITCQECSKFGKVQREPQKLGRSRGAARRGGVRRQPRPIEPTYEVLENYNEIVRKAREKKEWSREELGEKIYEKASVISRVESGKMVPDIKLAKKFERILHVTLLEKTSDVTKEDFGSSKIKGATIGDIAKIKRH
jgi:putative transcription factor